MDIILNCKSCMYLAGPHDQPLAIPIMITIEGEVRVFCEKAEEVMENSYMPGKARLFHCHCYVIVTYTLALTLKVPQLSLLAPVLLVFINDMLGGILIAI